VTLRCGDERAAHFAHRSGCCANPVSTRRHRARRDVDAGDAHLQLFDPDTIDQPADCESGDRPNSSS
jgi:hypothetical protein